MNTQAELHGRCLCGTVTLAATLEKREVGVCHCGICRKWGGGPLFAVECGDSITFGGEEHVSVYGSSDWAERGFCKHCGTHLFYRLKDGGFHALPVGIFDEQHGWHFDQQVFVDEKPTFYSFAEQTKELTGAEVFAQFAAAKK